MKTEASGNVAMGAGLRSAAKAAGIPPDPTARAPEIYPDPVMAHNHRESQEISFDRISEHHGIAHVSVLHFGDLDPNGVRIFLHLRERRPDLRYLVQPFESSELSATLRALLRTRAAERNAHRLASELQEAVRVRDEFLSIASHELKTALTSLQLQLDGMQRSLAGETANECCRKLAQKLDTALRHVTKQTG